MVFEYILYWTLPQAKNQSRISYIHQMNHFIIRRALFERCTVHVNSNKTHHNITTVHLRELQINPLFNSKVLATTKTKTNDPQPNYILTHHVEMVIYIFLSALKNTGNLLSTSKPLVLRTCMTGTIRTGKLPYEQWQLGKNSPLPRISHTNLIIHSRLGNVFERPNKNQHGALQYRTSNVGVQI